MDLINSPVVLATVPAWLYPVAMLGAAIFFAWFAIVPVAMFWPSTRKDYRFAVAFAIFGAVMVIPVLDGLNS